MNGHEKHGKKRVTRRILGHGMAAKVTDVGANISRRTMTLSLLALLLLLLLLLLIPWKVIAREKEKEKKKRKCRQSAERIRNERPRLSRISNSTSEREKFRLRCRSNREMLSFY